MNTHSKFIEKNRTRFLLSINEWSRMLKGSVIRTHYKPRLEIRDVDEEEAMKELHYKLKKKNSNGML